MSTIVFQVNLSQSHRYTDRPPCDSRSEADNFASTRVTWFPDIFGVNRRLKHGDQFTLTGANAYYLKQNYTTGEFKFLDIITETAES